MLRFGIIGCSRVARRRFLPALKKSPLARLEHIGSRDAARAEEFAREFGGARTGDYAAVLNDPAVDAVYISTPITHHNEWVRQAAAAGKHVLCEKPAFTNFAMARDLVDLAAQHRVRLKEGWMFRHHPQHAVVLDLIRAGRMGETRAFSGEFTYPAPPPGDFRLDPALGGGVFLDALGYPVAAALMLLAAPPASVFCELDMDPTHAVDRRASLMMKCADGAVAHCLAGFGLHYRSRYAVLGTRGRVEAERAYAVPPDSPTMTVFETESGVEKFTTPPADQFQLMIEDFARQISGESPRTGWEGDLLKQHLVMDCARRSAAEARAVEIPGILWGR